MGVSRAVEMSDRVLTDSRKRPLKGLAEAIWNSLDVGADHVNVEFRFTDLGAIDSITVTDDGQGMSRDGAELGFHTYGDSWKRRTGVRTYNGRTVHGQRGQGRYDILHLGTYATRTSVAEQVGGEIGSVEVSLLGSDPRNYGLSEPLPHSGPTGTRLRIANEQWDTAEALEWLFDDREATIHDRLFDYLNGLSAEWVRKSEWDEFGE